MCEQNILECLFAKANETLSDNPSVEQVVAIQTASGRNYIILNERVTSGCYEAEQHFLEMLAKCRDTHVTHVLALWDNRQPDLPSFHLRSQLAALDQRNMAAYLWMCDQDEFYYRTLDTTL